MTVDLRPMTGDEFAGWLGRARDEYAEAVRIELGYTAEAAREKANGDFGDLLPDGVASSGQTMLTAEDSGSGELVGYLWFGERDFGGQRIGFVWNIEVLEAARGRGYGRAIMSALEARVSARGIERIDLNVFGGNQVARALYRSLGYRETHVGMSKVLPSEG
jgi:ribosomal protein S18 acetylase RimI-like enzyme